jgi:hypothetical protein
MIYSHFPSRTTRLESWFLRMILSILVIVDFIELLHMPFDFAMP